MHLQEVILRGLAAWRLAYMLVNEVGPNRIFVKLRNFSGIETDQDGNTIFSTNQLTPLSCVYCTSIYTTFLLLLLPRPVATWLAGAAVAAIVERTTSGQVDK